ncbi:LTA synthase family protein [Pseudomonas syringae pv. actinidiae]|nr:LTA synthase family protein [Pseudomonas syringae pv. actinidiae]
MNRQSLKNACLFLVVICALTAAPSLARHLEGYSSVQGSLSDLACALLIGSLVANTNRIARAPIIMVWTLLQIGSYMLLGAMARLPSWSDFHFLMDRSFVENSAGEIGISQWIMVAFMILAASVSMAFPRRTPSDKSMVWGVGSVALIILAAGGALCAQKVLVKKDEGSENLYSYYNPVHWLAAEAYQNLTQNSTPLPAPTVMQEDLSGQSLISGPGKAKNVLIVAMEGMTGAYLAQARDQLGITTEDPALLFPKLSEFSKQGMVTPDFITHSHQTIRGLYSILCADMDKLSNGAPKAVELQNSPQRAANCLPSVLKNNGYSTHYLQGAGLAFMGKDRIMPMIGFQQTHGNEWFTKRHHLNFGWGVDDKTFFEGALSYIETLQSDAKRAPEKPWMLTLLTVGTHQPYAAPDKMIEKYGSRKAASVAYLDDSVTAFLQSLKRRGVLKDTLVIITSDESHGSEMADWVSSWGINIVFAPEAKQLPPVNKGQYALSDTSLSVLDYLGLEPQKTAGRSLFRTYSSPREMVSNTSGRLRWLKDGMRYECSALGDCRTCPAQSIIGFATCDENKLAPFAELSRKAAWLDQSVTRLSDQTGVLNFASGAVYHVKQGYQNEWMDNLIGAQYLDFPAKTRTTVTMKWKMLSTGEEGGALKMSLKQSEQDVKDVSIELPTIMSGEEKEYTFVIDNPERRYNFSFHLLPKTPMDIDLMKFTVRNDPI